MTGVQHPAPALTAALPIRSVVDFGCGQGAWLSVWAAGGMSSTPDDLTGFIRADLGRKLFGQGSAHGQST